MTRFLLLLNLLLVFGITTVQSQNSEKLPTIQEAWVDSGYFEWQDNTQTSLKITELGADQEYLSDVCDGEQLTSISGMFTVYDGLSKEEEYPVVLKKAPKFNTSNITNFSGMFVNCTYLESIPDYNTANGTSFTAMFEDCEVLTAIPKLNTAKATNLNAMFCGCKALVTIPKLDTSEARNFEFMFADCKVLTEIPELNTANGIYFNSMFLDCEALVHKPNLNLSKAQETVDMYKGTQFE